MEEMLEQAVKNIDDSTSYYYSIRLISADGLFGLEIVNRLPYNTESITHTRFMTALELQDALHWLALGITLGSSW